MLSPGIIDQPYDGPLPCRRLVCNRAPKVLCLLVKGVPNAVLICRHQLHRDKSLPRLLRESRQKLCHTLLRADTRYLLVLSRGPTILPIHRVTTTKTRLKNPALNFTPQLAKYIPTPRQQTRARCVRKLGLSTCCQAPRLPKQC